MNKEEKIEKIAYTLIRFKQVLDSSECECDSYHTYECTVHSDKKLVEESLKLMKNI